MTISKEEKTRLVEQVQRYFEDQSMEEIGNLSAEQLIEYMLDILGPFAYNQALFDVNKTIKAHFAQLEDAMFILEKPHKRR